MTAVSPQQQINPEISEYRSAIILCKPLVKIN